MSTTKLPNHDDQKLKLKALKQKLQKKDRNGYDKKENIYIKIKKGEKGSNKNIFGIDVAITTSTTKLRIALGSTTLIIIGQFCKLLKTFPKVVLTLIGSSGC
jgi:hypothetical protein